MSDLAIEIVGGGKMYKIFPSRVDNLLDALGINRVLPFRSDRYREFWAVRDVDLELRHGQRLGVIGRNGAGKSTLLKMITGSIAATEGIVRVDGHVQALFDAGAGLHPEFTGRENVRASLTYQGLSHGEIRRIETEIADFTELGDFLDQPFRTYSLGMQARLGFAIATAIRPEILIVDEVLGAGDAYFFSKSTARMTELVEGGASVLLVSHSLQHVMRFCDETIWMDRGRVVMRGPTMEVVKAYEKYIRVLQARQLRAKNEKARASATDAFERESYDDQILVRLSVRPESNAELDVAEVKLIVDGEVEERVEVGGTQDADGLHPAFLLLNDGYWSSPSREAGVAYRSLNAPDQGHSPSLGHLLFRLWFFYPQSEYAIDISYRLRGGSVDISAGRGNELLDTRALSPSETWRTERMVLSTTAEHSADTEADEDEVEPLAADDSSLSRWPGQKGLRIENVRLLDLEGESQVIFMTGEPMTVEATIRVEETGDYPLYLAAIIFRDDGLIATRHVSGRLLISRAADEQVRAWLEFGDLLLGNGTYLLSLGLYSKLDVNDIEPSEVYDYFDKSYEFRVGGNPRLHNEIVRHPGGWKVEGRDVSMLDSDEASEGAHPIELT